MDNINTKVTTNTKAECDPEAMACEPVEVSEAAHTSWDQKHCKYSLYTTMALLPIAVATALVVVYSTKKAKEHFVQQQVIYATETPTAPPATDSEALGIDALIEEKVLQRNAKFSTMETDDPRWLALDWILHEDAMQLGLSDLNLFQRYVLALLAFQFDSLAWTSCGGNYSEPGIGQTCIIENEDNTDTAEEYGRWLTSTPECDWYGVTCLEGKVHKLELGESQ